VAARLAQEVIATIVRRCDELSLRPSRVVPAEDGSTHIYFFDRSGTIDHRFAWLDCSPEGCVLALQDRDSGRFDVNELDIDSQLEWAIGQIQGFLSR
jgi:hypothetical protein